MYNLYVFCGKSGSGKTAVMDKLESQYDMTYPRSYTTRLPRKTKPPETNHVFVSEAVFNIIEDFVCTSDYNGYHYGTRKNQVNSSNMMVLDVKGIKSLKENYSDKPIKVICIESPDSVRKQRMGNRGDTENQINGRIDRDKEEFKELDSLIDVKFINNEDTSIDELTEQIYSYIEECEKSINE